MALSPEWANLPKRRCDDCGKTYKPTRPRRILNGKQELSFCCDNCRKSYHKHGGAYRKLKAEMQKMVAKALPEMLVLFTTCAECKGTGKRPTGRRDGSYYSCEACNGFPRTLTRFGEELQSFVRHEIEDRIADMSVR